MPDVFINEFHYDDASVDSGEFIEIAGLAGTDLTGWQLVRYNGSTPGAAVAYTSPGSISLSGVLEDDTGTGWGFRTFTLPTDGIQNGSNDGFALVDGSGTVIELISYEGVFTASNGPAAGMTSVDVGVSETGGADNTSIQRVGTFTATSQPFTWQLVTGTTPEGVNAGQTLEPIDGDGSVQVSINDVTIVEGDDGISTATFTISRTDDTGAFSVDVNTANGTATAGQDYVAVTNQTVSFTVGGPLTQTVTVTINGDTTVEPGETFTVNLSNLVNTTGTAEIADGQATGTITNDDVTRIYDIQGLGHVSEYAGQQVTTRGVVTALATNGYYIQDETGDGDVNTSDGLFVFTGGAPSVAVGDDITVRGTVTEFKGGGRASDLSLTELTGSTVVTTHDTGNTIAATLLGEGGRQAPLVSYGDDDVTGVYDPATQGMDFWESLEGMKVTAQDLVLGGPFRSNFGEVVAYMDDPNNAAINPRGGLTISDTTPGVVQPEDREFDLNPERIQLDDRVVGGSTPIPTGTGDRLGDVTGIISYEFGAFDLNSLAPVTIVEESTLEKEVTNIEGSLDRIRIASFNVENLAPVGEPVDGQPTPLSKFNGLADAIINNLKLPEIIALQEVLDNDGATNTGVVSAAETLSQLITAINSRPGGVQYIAIDSPPADDDVGGIPGGNQRVAYLYRADAVAPSERNNLSTTAYANVFTVATASQIGQPNNPDFAATRGSLPIEWQPAGYTDEQGGTFWTVNNHLSSKGGSAPLFGTNGDLPLYADPLNGSSQFDPNDINNPSEREGQAEAVNAFVDGILNDSNSFANDRVVVLGDLNDFQFFPVVDLITGELVRTQANPTGTPSVFAPGEAVLQELISTLPVNERYSYNFDGNAQALDHILVSNNLFDTAFFDIVHINSEFADQLSDHDPSVSSLVFLRSDAIATSGDDVIDQAAFSATFTGALAARADLTGADMIDGLAGDDRLFGYAGDDTLLGGADKDTLLGGIGNDVLNGQGGVDTASYATAEAGVRVSLLSTLAQDTGEGLDVLVSIEKLIGSRFADALEGDEGENELSGGDGADELMGRAGSDILNGGDGFDTLAGGLDSDKVRGGDGADQLTGGEGKDKLTGGAGADTLIGGEGRDFLAGDQGPDHFVFNAASDSARRSDRIADFSQSDGDLIDLSGVDADVATSGDDDFILVTDFSGAAGELRLVQVASGFLVQGEVDGDRRIDFEVFVATGDELNASDFVF